MSAEVLTVFVGKEKAGESVGYLLEPFPPPACDLNLDMSADTP
jgi:hypothetical protein